MGITRRDYLQMALEMLDIVHRLLPHCQKNRIPVVFVTVVLVMILFMAVAATATTISAISASLLSIVVVVIDTIVTQAEPLNLW